MQFYYYYCYYFIFYDDRSNNLLIYFIIKYLKLLISWLELNNEKYFSFFFIVFFCACYFFLSYHINVEIDSNIYLINYKLERKKIFVLSLSFFVLLSSNFISSSNYLKDHFYKDYLLQL